MESVQTTGEKVAEKKEALSDCFMPFLKLSGGYEKTTQCTIPTLLQILVEKLEVPKSGN
jgi:hypothetical protein